MFAVEASFLFAATFKMRPQVGDSLVFLRCDSLLIYSECPLSAHTETKWLHRSDSPAGTWGRRTGQEQEQLYEHPPAPSAPTLAPPPCSTQQVMSQEKHSTVTWVRTVRQPGVHTWGWRCSKAVGGAALHCHRWGATTQCLWYRPSAELVRFCLWFLQRGNRKFLIYIMHSQTSGNSGVTTAAGNVSI